MLSRLLFVPIAQLFSWGGDGHAIVTQVANSLISEQGYRFVENLVGSDFIEASKWADTDEASERYPDSENLHFSHTPYRDCKPFVLNRDCGFRGKEGLCIVTGLADAIMMVIDPDIARENRTDAFKFVLHFMGDIHQPLHTGFREDAGGTAIDIRNAPNATLHTLWDYGLIENKVADKTWVSMSESILASLSKSKEFVPRISSQNNISQILLNGTRDRLVEYIGTIASDTSMTATCSVAYTNEKKVYIVKGDLLTDDYYRKGELGVQVQLTKASVRLSLLIDAMAEIFAARLAEQKEQRREIRVEKLFEESRRIAAEKAAHVHDPLAGNRFAILSIEFNEEDYLFDSDGPVGDVAEPIGKLSKKQVKAMKAARKALEARRAKIKSKRDERRRIARYVEGIDLNSLVLIKRSGQYFVTYHRFVTSRTFNPLQYIVIFVRFLNQAEGDEPIGFLLDTKIFKREPTTEFLTRMFKAMKGEDDETSGGESFRTETIASVESFGDRQDKKYGADPVMEVFTRIGGDEKVMRETDRVGMDGYMEQFKTVDERIRFEERLDSMNIAQLGNFDKDMIVIPHRGTFFVSAMRFCKNPENMQFILNKHSLIDSRKSIEQNFSLMIDQRLLDEQMTPGVVKIIQRAILSPTVEKRSLSLSQVNPVLVRNVKIFAEGFGTSRADADMISLAQFKKFQRVPRPDKPLLLTFNVDFSIDLTQRDMVAAMLKSFMTFATPSPKA